MLVNSISRRDDSVRYILTNPPIITDKPKMCTCSTICQEFVNYLESPENHRFIKRLEIGMVADTPGKLFSTIYPIINNLAPNTRIRLYGTPSSIENFFSHPAYTNLELWKIFRVGKFTCHTLDKCRAIFSTFILLNGRSVCAETINTHHIHVGFNCPKVVNAIAKSYETPIIV